MFFFFSNTPPKKQIWRVSPMVMWEAAQQSRKELRVGMKETVTKM